MYRVAGLLTGIGHFDNDNDFSILFAGFDNPVPVDSAPCGNVVQCPRIRTGNFQGITC